MMPPKRKAAGKAAASKAKKSKQEEQVAVEETVPETMKDKIVKLRAADKGRIKKCKPDIFCPISAVSEVYEDYDAMLNQTNIGHNNNKYYIIQVLKSGETYYAWNRWGRVGEPGQESLKPFFDVNAAIKDFEKKFKDKTKNDWKDREKFAVVPGKYTLLEMAGDEDEEEDQVDAVIMTEDGAQKKVLPSTLDKPTQYLMKLIFDHDMIMETLQQFDIDVKKMPLGKLSKTQIARGFEVLKELEEAITKNASASKIVEVTSKFYTVIPHTFGRNVPPPIKTTEELQKKYDMLAVLGDIEMAQSMQKDKDSAAADESVKVSDTVPNPLDVNYEMLNCKLKLLDKTSAEYKIIEKYFKATEGNMWRKMNLRDVWEMDRSGEDARYAANKKIGNRKLLWHGTSVAVAVAILKTGLRIMPHSGGRLGRGIYFASEHYKSAGFVTPAKNKVIMFLIEVALGKQFKITRDNGSLVAAPKGFDSVLACGRQEPDEKQDIVVKLDGFDVTVPQGSPKAREEYQSSYFSLSEYLVYREDQVRMRYVLLFDY